MFKEMYISPNGRCSRKFYLLFGFLPFFLIRLLLAFSIDVFNFNPYIEPVILLFFVWPMLAMQIKRWHDINLSGWYSLLTFIPFLGFVVMLVVGMIPGSIGGNIYGKDPLGRKVTTEAGTVKQEPAGIGGWLLIPAASLVIGPIAAFVSIFNLVSMYSIHASAVHAGLFYLLIIIEIGYSMFMVYAAVHFFLKKTNAPAMVIDLLVLSYLAPLAMALLFWLFNANEDIVLISIMSFIIAFFYANVIWIPYFKKSVRVKNTFINP